MIETVNLRTIVKEKQYETEKTAEKILQEGKGQRLV